MDINTKGEQFKQQIIDTINHSDLPLGLVYYMMKDIVCMVETAYSQALNSQNKDTEDSED